MGQKISSKVLRIPVNRALEIRFCEHLRSRHENREIFFSKDLLPLIISHLPGTEELGRASRVCKSWRAFSDTDVKHRIQKKAQTATYGKHQHGVVWTTNGNSLSETRCEEWSRVPDTGSDSWWKVLGLMEQWWGAYRGHMTQGWLGGELCLRCYCQTSLCTSKQYEKIKRSTIMSIANNVVDKVNATEITVKANPQPTGRTVQQEPRQANEEGPSINTFFPHSCRQGNLHQSTLKDCWLSQLMKMLCSCGSIV